MLRSRNGNDRVLLSIVYPI